MGYNTFQFVEILHFKPSNISSDLTEMFPRDLGDRKQLPFEATTNSCT